MEKLNQRLNETRRKLCAGKKTLSPNLIFGGYSIIFCGDFRQIPPVKAKESQLLYSNSSLWESSINVAIMLNNSHRFMDDPEYGDILKRMWEGKFTQKDCNAINERLIGTKVQLPNTENDDDISYACWKNSERVSIHACTFQNHIKDFPLVDSDDDPPEQISERHQSTNENPKIKHRKNILCQQN